MPLLFVFFLLLSSSLRAETPQVLAWNFDWDDNIAFMTTKIVLFDKKTGAELEISTGEFADVRSEVGKSGKYEGYELRDDATTGSYKYFRDGSGKNFFLEDIIKMVESGKPEQWQGPSWKAFVQACSRKDTARWTTIITARGHEAESMREGLKYLQKKGFIKYLPSVKHLYAVGNPKYKSTAASPSAAKTVVMKEILDRIQARGLSKNVPVVVNREGTGKARLHLWGFSDDDYGNFEKAVTELSAGVKAGKWKNVKITVFYTGKTNPKIPPHSVVIQPDGTVRPVQDAEHTEVTKILKEHLGAKHSLNHLPAWLKECALTYGTL